MDIYLQHSSDDLQIVQLMPLSPIVSYAFLVLVYSGCPGKEAVEQVL